jgi:alpha-galactosidase
MLGRVHLSGHLDQMSRQQRDLVVAAVRVYKDIRADPWIALGLRAPGVSYLTVWHRGSLSAASGPPGDTTRTGDTVSVGDPAEAILPIPQLRGQPLTAKTLYPVGAGADVSWDAGSGALMVFLPRTPSACVISLMP